MKITFSFSLSLNELKIDLRSSNGALRGFSFHDPWCTPYIPFETGLKKKLFTAREQTIVSQHVTKDPLTSLSSRRWFKGRTGAPELGTEAGTRPQPAPRHNSKQGGLTESHCISLCSPETTARGFRGDRHGATE